MKNTTMMLIVVLVLSFTANLVSKPTSGTIYFTDGNTLKFTDMERSGFGQATHKVTVDYKGTKRSIPNENMKWIEIKNFSKIVSGWKRQVKDATVKYETTTGIVDSFCHPYLHKLIVYMNDELTGIYKKQTIEYAVSTNGRTKLNVKKIVFDN